MVGFWFFFKLYLHSVGEVEVWGFTAVNDSLLDEFFYKCITEKAMYP